MPSLRQTFNRVRHAPATWAATGILLAGLATYTGFHTMNEANPEVQARHKVMDRKEPGTPEEYKLALRSMNDTGAAMALALLAVGSGWMWERKRAKRALDPEFRRAAEDRETALQQQAAQEADRQVEAAAEAMHEGVCNRVKVGKALRLKVPTATNS